MNIQSIKDKLLNISKETGQTYNNILLRYFHERVLARIYSSKFNSNFLLKGGLYLALISGFSGRTTQDIDLLVFWIILLKK